jgi:nitroreductase
MEVNGRTAHYPIDRLFLERWSPRAYTGEAIPDAELMTIFEAARWAPSSYNQQPWRFIYAKRDSPRWELFLSLLVEGNRNWAKNTAVLVIVVSKTTMDLPGRPEPVPSHTHSFDAGAAWGCLALQAQRSGWHAHGMIGFDVERARRELNVPDGYRVEAAIAIGRRGDKAILPEALQAREAPNGRRPVAETAVEGTFRVP